MHESESVLVRNDSGRHRGSMVSVLEQPFLQQGDQGSQTAGQAQAEMDGPASAVEERKEPIANLGAFLRSQLARGRSAGIGVQTLKAGSQNAAAVTFAVLAFSILVMYLYEYETYLWIQYAVAGGVIICGLLLLRINFDFSGKEEILLDGWTDYLENEMQAKTQTAYAPAAGETQDRTGSNRQARETPRKSREEEQISQVREGIRQTAAADSRFSGMLTPEEEKLMRQIIREYMK